MLAFVLSKKVNHAIPYRQTSRLGPMMLKKFSLHVCLVGVIWDSAGDLPLGAVEHGVYR